MAVQISTNVEFIQANTAINPGFILLPTTTALAGRFLTIKDVAGTFDARPLTLSTIGNDRFEDGANLKRLVEEFGYITLASDGVSKWYTIDGTSMNTYTISSLTNSLSMSTQKLHTSTVTLSTFGFVDRNFNSVSTLYTRSTLLYLGSNVIGGSKCGPTQFIPMRGAFQPNQVAGLNLWLDAADVNTVVIQNNIVRQWNDKSGNSRNLVTVLSNAGTITYSQYGGVPSILFNSTYTQNLNGAYMRVVSPVNLTNLTVFSVVRCRTATNNQNGLLAVPASGYEYSSTDAFGHFIDSATPQDRFYANGSGTPIQNAVVSSGGDAFPLRISAFTCTSAGVLSSWGNGTAGQTRSGGARGGTATGFGIGFDILMPGGSPVNLTCTSQFSECIVYNVVVTTTQREQVEGYLAWKWGLVVLLPPTHPYKYAPP